MNDDQSNQGINEGQRGRPIVSSYPISRGRSASGWRKSNINSKRGSRSLVLLSSPRLGLVITLSTADTAATVPPENDAASHPPASTSVPYSERSHLEQTATVSARYLVTRGPLPPDEIASEGPCTTKRTRPENDEYREQAFQGSPGPINQAACPPSRGTPAQKPKVDRLRVLKKILAALRKRKLSTPPRQSESPSPPVHSPPPMIGNRTAESELYVDRASCYLTAPSSPASWSRSEIAEDDDNTSFFTAMSGEPEHLTEPLSEINSPSLVPLKSASLPSLRLSLYSARSVSYFSLPDVGGKEPTQSDAYAPNTLLPTPTLLPDHDLLSDSPEGYLRQRPRVNTADCMPEEMGGESPRTDSSGSMPTSPQSVVQSNAPMAVSPPIASDHPTIGREDIEETKDFDLDISKIENHESLHIQMELESQLAEVDERVINADMTPEEGTPPPDDGASGTASSKTETTRESIYLETQERHVMQTINALDTGQDATTVPTPVDVVKEQTVQRAESQTTGQLYTLCVLDEHGQPPPPRLPERPFDLPTSSGMSMQETLSNIVEDGHMYLVSEAQTTGHAKDIASQPAGARGELTLPTRSSDKQPSDMTSESGVQVQESTTHSLVQKATRTVETTSSLKTASAADVLEPGVDFTAEALQQFFQMVEKRFTLPGSDEKAKQNNGAKPVNIVLNVTNNHIHNVSHGAAGDNYYGAIGHSAVGGQGGRNNIRNSQISEISEFMT